MVIENSQMRTIASNMLSGKWGPAVVFTLVYLLLSAVCSGIPYVGAIGILLVGLPLSYGFIVNMLRFTRGETLDVDKLFMGFKDYGRVLGTMLLMSVYTFLWTLLLIVPGIIKRYSYALTPYLLYDNPELSYDAAIERSMAMMEGHKMRLFLLDLSFIGWFLLGIISFGIGLLWVQPYFQTARAIFYEDLKRELLANQMVANPQVVGNPQ